MEVIIALSLFLLWALKARAKSELEPDSEPEPEPEQSTGGGHLDLSLGSAGAPTESGEPETPDPQPESSSSFADDLFAIVGATPPSGDVVEARGAGQVFSSGRSHRDDKAESYQGDDQIVTADELVQGEAPQPVVGDNVPRDVSRDDELGRDYMVHRRPVGNDEGFDFWAPRS